ncbi:acid-sensing ion channel 1C [Nematostella vectensis]|uniref:acid-sensing ion channel 1C n=1 Tax=Nematostella vectensis TaxID=45351 RepID=UPI00138FBA92|nr:acid-sensing ion channel 1C [Nematostella vectensis]XP_032220871.1 acid-sensing ion channel 1C [Nematostella vectensis]XP_032220872.1 acid-sensing ion channel 1C [Nematostella vectensis]XP_048580998.1 acid-sensing ion channel 1C [Nematostella vectensis]XP_048580999.1 acid-sensing ion channel 1C [Nematostella vectensis]
MESFNQNTKTDIKDCKEDEKREPQPTMLQDFAGYTTLHGFHFLIHPGSPFRRFIWLLMLLGCWVALFYQLYNSVDRLLAHRIVMSRGVEQPDEIDFPAITICNQNIMRMSKINGTEAQKYLDELDDVFRKDIKKENVSYDAETFVNKYGHDWENMFENIPYSCMFQRFFICSAKNFTSFLSFTRGLCYTYNSGVNRSYVQRVSEAGRNNRLEFHLEAHPEEYYGPYSYEGIGFKIAVHDQSYVPNMDQEGYDITAGFYTNVRVKRYKEKSLPHPYKTNCGERKLEYYERYSRSACILECQAREFVRKTKCRIIGFPPIKVIRDVPFCSVLKIETGLTYMYYNWNTNQCDCPKPCVEISYSAQMSLLQYPTPSLVREIRKSFNDTEDYINNMRANSVIVSIFYETLLTDVFEEKNDYDISRFGSDLGGNLGLFLGCSLLTLVEFFDLGIRWCLGRKDKVQRS